MKTLLVILAIAILFVSCMESPLEPIILMQDEIELKWKAYIFNDKAVKPLKPEIDGKRHETKNKMELQWNNKDISKK